MNFADDLVVYDPLPFFDFLGVVFAANFFGFGSYSCLWFNQVWWPDSRRVSNIMCLDASGFLNFVGMSCVGVWVACSRWGYNHLFAYVLEYHIWYAYVLEYCFWLACSHTVFVILGA